MKTAIVAGAACPKNPDLLLGFVKKIVWRWGVRIAVDERGREWLVSRRRGVRLVEAFEIVDEVVCGVPAPVVRPMRAVSQGSEHSRGGLAAAVGGTGTPPGFSTGEARSTLGEERASWRAGTSPVISATDH
ncbi:hypothetical protein [Gordonia sp. NB41Y]|uniref:hypothetical protein n=1 Tax=Gordonia sp. NB41Y TaxID=875808 RepID=UPI00128F36E9|nr:hypothetical protein [Gordonia sp. NB41Y]WLP89116.1 hypothetical protein Q9K23_16085 [Gordonia sp. NB41Y]